MSDNEQGKKNEGDAKENGDLKVENTGLRNMLARYNNDAMATAAELYSQTFALRDERRKLKQEVKDLQAKVPQEGSVVLGEAEAKTWETYQALGKPEEVQTQLEDARKDRRMVLVSKAAKRHGYNETVLDRMLGEKAELVVEKNQEGEENYQVKAGDKAMPISDLVKSWGDDAERALLTSKQSGNRVVGQPGAREGGKADYVGDYLNAVQPVAKEGDK